MELALLLSLFLLTAPAQSHLQQEALFDTEGNPLMTATQYRVMPAVPSNTGGLRLTKVNGSCPTHVSQHSNPYRLGQPVMFFEGINAGGVVPPRAGLYILVPRPSSCPQSTLWTVDGEGFVTTGGAVNLTDPLASRFAITKVGEQGYQIRVFCSVCVQCKILCANVVAKEVGGKSLLTLAFSEYLVVFERVKQPTLILPGAMHIQE